MGNIGSLSGIGKIENGGGGSGTNLVLKKIYKSEGGIYLTCLLPASVQTFSNLLTYMSTNCPYRLNYVTRTVDGVTYKQWIKTTSINCSGVHTFDESHGVEVFFDMYTIQRYNGDPDSDVDMSLFPDPTSLTTNPLYRTSNGVIYSRAVTLLDNDGWLIADV